MNIKNHVYTKNDWNKSVPINRACTMWTGMSVDAGLLKNVFCFFSFCSLQIEVIVKNSTTRCCTVTVIIFYRTNCAISENRETQLNTIRNAINVILLTIRKRFNSSRLVDIMSGNIILKRSVKNEEKKTSK